jgi:D-arabinose 1-dehydrogenase-like Zn-dependent alcohol dehydrogenase
MNIEKGRIVAVQGIGGLGHLGLQYVRQMGYRTVALSSGPSKRNLISIYSWTAILTFLGDQAIAFGAHEYIDGSEKDQGEELQKMGSAALIVVTAPNPEGIPKLVKGCKSVDSGAGTKY